jgi:PTH1 family peptidyl-tRNA hydrolase
MTSRQAAEDSEATPRAVLRPVLVVGFGNPGNEYASTRHNVGVWCVRALGRRYHAQFERRGKLEAATVEIEGRTVHIARPRSYVNESGPPIAAELRRLKLEPSQLLAIYDDLDQPVGQVRIRLSGGHGGHNGMRSLIGVVGNEFPRIRVGIDRPYDDGRPVREPDRIAEWVLAAPSKVERERLEAAVEAAADAVVLAVTEGVELAMNRFNPTGG